MGNRVRHEPRNRRSQAKGGDRYSTGSRRKFWVVDVGFDKPPKGATEHSPGREPRETVDMVRKAPEGGERGISIPLSPPSGAEWS